MAHLEIRNLHKSFGAFTALAQINLSVEKGEFLVLLGPSGCGKTTLLRTIAGLERQDNGEIFHGGQDIPRHATALRDFGIVFQSYALFPNLSVGDNVAYGLKSRKAHRGSGRQAVQARVQAMLELVGLPGIELKFPAQLSGGQQQRVALARALATTPDLLLLDEPLSALDAIERVRLRSEIHSLQRQLGVTTIMVTHDQEEALAMADRIVVMDRGRIRQIGSPREIYGAPANEFVADFIGRGNFIDGIAQEENHVRCGEHLLRSSTALPKGQSCRFYVRAEDISLHETVSNDENSFYANVLKHEFLGAYSLLTLSAGKLTPNPLLMQISSSRLEGMMIKAGAMLRVGIAAHTLRPLAESA